MVPNLRLTEGTSNLVPGATMNRNGPTVLILSSDPAFARKVTGNWPSAFEAPEFVVMKEDLCHELRRDVFDLAIADAPAGPKRKNLTAVLASIGKPAILIGSGQPHSGAAAAGFGRGGQLLFLPRELAAWAAMAGLLGREILRRGQAEFCARDAERLRTAAEAEATLGRYMVEMRHNFNNALTSVLGNAELLLLEPGLPAPALAQADTIRNMALRLHEIFQRFSSLEKELSAVARESGKQAVTHAAANPS
jgi:signal transduction histidine kinase